MLESENFGLIVRELSTRSESPDVASVALARALTYPRRDSSSAGKALLRMGNRARAATAELVSALKHNRPDVRRYAALVLGVIGGDAQCAIPELAMLLWDRDQYVRSAAAAAMESIITVDLVEPQDEISL